MLRLIRKNILKGNQNGEQNIVRMKRKINKGGIKRFKRTDNILLISRCTAMKDKTSMQYTFFVGVEF